MGPLDLAWHLINFLAVAIGLGLVAAAAAKLVWRRELAGVAWRRLALGACGASTLLLIAGLVAFGRDGRMATYGLMVLATAIALWWLGFGPGRR